MLSLMVVMWAVMVMRMWMRRRMVVVMVRIARNVGATHWVPPWK